MSDKVEIPIDTAQLVLARRGVNKNPSIEINSDGQIVPRNNNHGHDSDHEGYDNNSNNADFTVMVRKAKNDYLSGNIPRKAKSLKECKGLKGCEFASCAKEVFGKLPKRLQGLCPTRPDQQI